MLRSIVPAINLENGSKQPLFKFFFVLFTRPASPSSIYISLPLPLVLLTTTAKKKTLFVGIHVSSRGIAGFTDQWTAFTRAQSAILRQSAKTAGHAQYELRGHPPSLPPFHFQNAGRRIQNQHVIEKATEPLIFLLLSFCGLVDNKCHHSRTCCGCFCSNRLNDSVKISC